MNELDRITFSNKPEQPHDMSAALSQYLAEDMARNAKSVAVTNGESTTNYLGAAKDVGKGVVNEFIEHPLNLLATAGEGALAGVALRYAPVPIRAGMVLGSLAVGAYDVSQNAPKWISDASTVVNGSAKTAAELAQAHAGLERFGGGLAEFGVGLGGVGLGMRLPEIGPAVVNPVNAYRTGLIPKEQILPDIRAGLKAGSKLNVDWSKDPEWVKPATEQFKAKVGPAVEQLKAKVGDLPSMEQLKAKVGDLPSMEQLKAKVSEIPAAGERALNSPVVQRASDAAKAGYEKASDVVKTGVEQASVVIKSGAEQASDAIQSGVEQVRSFLKGRSAASAEPAEAETVSPPAESTPAPGAPVVETEAPVVEADASPKVYHGEKADGSKFTVEEGPDPFAPSAEAEVDAPTVAAEAPVVETEAPVVEADASPKVHYGEKADGSKFTVEEEPDHFASPVEAEVDASTVAAEAPVVETEAPVVEADASPKVHHGEKADGSKFTVEEEPDHFASPAEAEVDAPTVEAQAPVVETEAPVVEADASPKVHHGEKADGSTFTVEEEPDHFAQSAEAEVDAPTVAAEAPVVEAEVPVAEAATPEEIERGAVHHAGPESDGRPYDFRNDLDHFKDNGEMKVVEEAEPTLDPSEVLDTRTPEIERLYTQIKKLPYDRLARQLEKVLKEDPAGTSTESQLLWNEVLGRLDRSGQTDYTPSAQLFVSQHS
ncbi:MAG: hypothetical protein EKK48_19330 [Candidatus Melainabacteria bacterium]|nr:MAG: hypothetical protein EKK48_19330 [Candidatus Melainabacteria bacterium]